MNGRVGQPHGRRKPVAHGEAHTHGQDAHGRDQTPMLDEVDLPEEKHGVGEHEQVTGAHLDGVEEDGLSRDVVEATRTRIDYGRIEVTVESP